MDPHTGVLPGLKVMVDRAKRWKFAWQQSPLAASPQEVKDGVEDGTKVGGARSPARSRRRQNRGNLPRLARSRDTGNNLRDFLAYRCPLQPDRSQAFRRRSSRLANSTVDDGSTFLSAPRLCGSRACCAPGKTRPAA